MLSNKFFISKFLSDIIFYMKICYTTSFLYQRYIIQQTLYTKIGYQHFYTEIFYPRNVLYNILLSNRLSIRKFVIQQSLCTKTCYPTNFVYGNFLSYKFIINVIINFYTKICYPINFLCVFLLFKQFSIRNLFIQKIFRTKFFIQQNFYMEIFHPTIFYVKICYPPSVLYSNLLSNNFFTKNFYKIFYTKT